MQTTAIRLFGQGCAEDLLRLYGKAATPKELYDFMIKDYGPIITLDMLQKALRKGADKGIFKIVIERVEVNRFGRHVKVQRFAF